VLHSQSFSSSPVSSCLFLQLALASPQTIAAAPTCGVPGRAAAILRKANPVPLQDPSTVQSDIRGSAAAILRKAPPEMPVGPFTVEAAEMSRGDVEVSLCGLGTQLTKRPRVQGP
jgi:hypothetical protein